MEYIETMIYSMLEQFPGVSTWFTQCWKSFKEYSFTLDSFKAMTHVKREKADKLDVFHLKSDSEMLSLESCNRSALTRQKKERYCLVVSLVSMSKNLKSKRI